MINSVIAHPSVLIKRSVFESVGKYNLNNDKTLDYDLWLRAINKVNFYNIQKYLYNYRIHSESLTGSIRNFMTTRRETYNLMHEHSTSSKLEEIVSEKERSILSMKFLIRYSPKVGLRKVFNNRFLTYSQKILFSVISLIPFRLRCLFFYFNPKLRMKYYFGIIRSM